MKAIQAIVLPFFLLTISLPLSADSCFTDDAALCQALRTENLEHFLTIDKVPHANPTKLLNVELDSIQEKTQTNATVTVDITYETYFVEQNYIATNRDKCELVLNLENEKWFPVYGYCVNMGREFGR